jgi:hypothetical protein
MNRLIIVSAVAAAAAAVSVPAFAGLSNNPSFNHRVPVHVPSQAKVVQLDDHGKVVDSRHSGPASTTVTSPTRSRSAEPGDDRGGATTEPGDDRGGATTVPGDDRGGATTAPGNGGATTEPGDDRGATTEPGDDSGGKGGSGASGGGHGG